MNTFSNPVAPKYFSEIQFTDTDWIIEMFPIIFGEDLDSVYLTSTTDTAYIKPGSLTPFNYCLLTQDSMVSVFNINPANDTLSIYLNLYDYDFPDDQITIGELRINTSQSLSRKWKPGIPETDFWYIDNTPTLGYENDTLNAMGTIHFHIIDENRKSIPYAGLFEGICYDDLFWGESLFVYTDSLGILDYDVYAKNNSFRFMKDGYYDADTAFFVAPDSSYSITLTMKMKENMIKTSNTETASQFTLSPAYPNPFNHSTTFNYHLPSDAFVAISVYSITGETVAELFKGYRYAGDYRFSWTGEGVSSGIYIIRMESNQQVHQQKCLLVK